MKRPNLQSVFSGIGNVAGQIAVAAEARNWLAQRREALLCLVARGDAIAVTAAAAMLDDFCTQFPPLAALVIAAMGGSPEQAIMAITSFDAQIGKEFSICGRDKFAAVQTAWRNLRKNLYPDLIESKTSK